MKNTIYTAESYGEFMKEQLISFETAKLAKEKGFNIFCIECYKWSKQHSEFDGETEPENKRISHNGYDKDVNGYPYRTLSELFPLQHNIIENHFSAPTQSLLQKWLREKHDINLRVASNSKTSHFPVNELLDLYKTIGYSQKDTKIYKTYEEALEKGLQEALKLI